MFVLYSCQEVGIKNGKAAFYIDDNDTPFPGVAFKRFGDFTEGYVELDVTGKFDSGENLFILMRHQTINDSYYCRVGDYDGNGIYDFFVATQRNQDTSIPTDRSKLIKYDVLTPADFQAGNVKIGCEIKDGVLSGYINRKLMVTYTLGSGTENESSTPNQDSPILTKGEVGFAFSTGSSNPISSKGNEQIQIDNFRIYYARPF